MPGDFKALCCVEDGYEYLSPASIDRFTKLGIKTGKSVHLDANHVIGLDKYTNKRIIQAPIINQILQTRLLAAAQKYRG